MNQSNTTSLFRGVSFLREEPDGKVITLWNEASCRECKAVLANGPQRLYTALTDQELQQRGAKLATSMPPIGRKYSLHVPLLCDACYQAVLDPTTSPLSRFE